MPETSVSTLVLELFLKYEFWRDHHHMISPDYFEKESRKIYDTIVLSHQRYEHDLNLQELEALVISHNPMRRESFYPRCYPANER